jgi:TonB family protein
LSRAPISRIKDLQIEIHGVNKIARDKSELGANWVSASHQNRPFDSNKLVMHILAVILIPFLSSFGYAFQARVLPQSEQETLSQETTKGIDLFQSGDTAGAIATLLRAVKANPDDVEGWHFLGRCYNRLGRTQEAIQAFSRAVKLRPSFVPSRIGLALALQRTNKFNEAAQEAEAALKLEPKCDDCRYVLALVALKKGDQRQAWREAVNALELNPKSAQARDVRNQALVNIYSQVLSPKLKIQEAQTKGALIQLNVFATQFGIILDPTMANLDFQRVQGDRFKYAIDFYDGAIAQSPTDADAQEWRERLESLHVWKGIILSGEDGLRKQQIFLPKDLSMEARPLNNPKYEYPDDFRDAGIKGEVLLNAVVGGDGQIQSILVVRELHPILTQQALSAARQQRFEPGIKEGKPVKTIVTLRYNFGVAPANK